MHDSTRIISKIISPAVFAAGNAFRGAVKWGMGLKKKAAMA
jgi:hypothetical protein